MTTSAGAISASNSIDSIEFAGSIKLVTNTITIASQVLSLTSPEACEYIPWLSIIASPLSVYSIIQDVRKQINLVRVSRKASDVAFWCMRSIDAVASGISGMLKPVLGSISLAGIPSTPAVDTVFKHVLPHTLFATSIVGCLVESWALGRTVVDYRTFCKTVTTPADARTYLNKVRSKTDQARFNEIFKRYDQLYDRMTDNQLLQAMVEVGRFSIYDHANGVACAIMGIAASALLIFGANYAIVVTGLVITAASLKITSVIIKNILIRKSENMVTLGACPNQNAQP